MPSKCNCQCIRVAPAKGQSLKTWNDSSINALIKAFTQVQTLKTAWESHRCQALIEVLPSESSESQPFVWWGSNHSMLGWSTFSAGAMFLQHHHAKTARKQSYCTCGILVLIKLLYMSRKKIGMISKTLPLPFSCCSTVTAIMPIKIRWFFVL